VSTMAGETDGEGEWEEEERTRAGDVRAEIAGEAVDVDRHDGEGHGGACEGRVIDGEEVCREDREDRLRTATSCLLMRWYALPREVFATFRVITQPHTNYQCISMDNTDLAGLPVRGAQRLLDVVVSRARRIYNRRKGPLDDFYDSKV